MYKDRYIVVIFMILLPILLFSVTRYVPSQYATIQLAINASDNGDIILISSGTYDPINLGNKGLTIEGIKFANVIIDGSGTQRCITMSQYSATPTYLRNLTIDDGYAYSKGGGIYSPNERELIIEQCVIQNCTAQLNGYYGGGGIYCSGSLELNGCEIYDCSTTQGCGGGIYINSGSLEIEKTEITYCESYLSGGGIYLSGSSNIDMYDCLVDHCTASGGGGLSVDTYCDNIENCKIYETDFSYNSASYGGAISLSQCSADIRNSKFNNNNSTDGSAIILSSQINPTLLDILIYISGSLFYSNESDYSTIKIAFAESYHLDQFKMTNSTMCNNEGGTYPGITFYTTITSDASISHSIIRDSVNPNYCDYDYCCLWDGATGIGTECFDDDPEFIDEEGNDFHLSWGSPCIDSGNPDNDGDFENWVFDEDDQDEDGSQLDRGCYSYEQDRWEYEDEDIVWMSFPKLPVDEEENEGYPVLGSAVFERFQETTFPDYIDLWQESDIGGAATFTGEYDEFNEEYDWAPQNFEFNSTDGVKIIVDDDYYDTNPLITGGLLCEPDTPLTVTTGANDLNWVGYFIPYTMNIMDALDETTLDKLTAIKTHDWSLYKIHGEWFGSNPPGGPTVSYGDMVELYTDEVQDFEFYWQSFGTSEESYERQNTQYFTYEEELDYQSIFVELGEEKPDEIAVYVDGVCMGAECVDVDSLLEIRAYLLEEPQGQEIEILTASGRSSLLKAEYRMVNDEGQSISRSIFTDRNKMYQTVSLKTVEEVPEPENVLSCYPNPFNPELTISFSLEETQPVILEVYNVKGQKVKTLVNETFRPDGYSIVWNGKDDIGNDVSSGVYFIRMQTGNDVFTGKAVLMK